mgnify:CR=1 FL=1
MLIAKMADVDCMKNFSVIRMSEDGGGVKAYYREWVRKSLD